MNLGNPLAVPVDAGGDARGKTRPFSLIPILGAPASGKSSLMVELAEQSLELGRDVRILDPANNWGEAGEWPELADDYRSPEEIADAWLVELLRARYKRPDITPMTLFIDDADTFLDGAKARGPFRRLFTTFRHYRLDVVITGRRTQDLPKIIFTSASFVYLFRHYVSTGYIRDNYGPEVERAIPTKPFEYTLFDVSSRELSHGKTTPRVLVTAADGV